MYGNPDDYLDFVGQIDSLVSHNYSYPYATSFQSGYGGSNWGNPFGQENYGQTGLMGNRLANQPLAMVQNIVKREIKMSAE